MEIIRPVPKRDGGPQRKMRSSKSSSMSTALETGRKLPPILMIDLMFNAYTGGRKC